MDNKYEKKNSGVGGWIGFVIGLIVSFNIFPPLGIFLILWKFGFFGKKTNSKNISNDSQRNSRLNRYRAMTEGRQVESIAYLASAVGVSYEAALRDIQQMVSEGQFGPDAYINYVDKTIVLRSAPSSRQAGDARTNGAARPTGQASSVHRNQPQGTVRRSGPGAPPPQTTPRPEKSAKAQSKKAAKPFGSLPTWLMVVGIIASIVGVASLSTAIDMLSWWGFEPAEFLSATFWLASGAASFIARGVMKKRTSRFKVYQSAVYGKDVISLQEMSTQTGVKMRTLIRDLEIMIDKGLLTDFAYIDHGEKLLVLTPGASPAAKPADEPTPDDGEDHYREIIKEIRELNDLIPDEDMSRRIDDIESLTASIFRAVQEKPEKLPQIKSFMSYYLPTTLKLLRTYADFGASGADGETVTGAKAEIERILDTLVDGFKKQLDKLYEADALDISSDINVLETMLRRDGLSEDASGFGDIASGGITGTTGTSGGTTAAGN